MLLLQYYKVLYTPYYKVLLQYYSVLQSTTTYNSSTALYYRARQRTTPVLLCTAKYYSIATLYYKVLLQYCSVLQSTTPVLLCIVLLQYCSVLQRTTPVLLCTTKYHSNTILYYKIPLQYYSSTTLYCKVLLHRAEQQESSSNLTKYCVWHKKSLMIDPHHIWNVRTAPQNESHDGSASHMKRHFQDIPSMKSSSRTRRFGDLTRRILETNFVLKNTTLPAPAISQKVTKCCACHEKLQCTCCKYCACHAKRMSGWMRITYETPFALRAASGVILQLHQILRLPLKINLMIDPRLIWNVIYSAQSKWSHRSNSPSTAPATKFWVQDLSEKSLNCFRQNTDDSSMIRGYSEHEIVISHPPLRRPYNISRSGYLPKSHQMLRLPRKVTVHLLERLRPPRKSQSTLTKFCASHSIFTTCCACTKKMHSTLFSLGIYSLLASILSWHLFSLGIYSLWASIRSGHLFSLGIYSLWASILSWHLFSMGIYSLWASILSGHLFSLGIYSLLASILYGHLFALGIYSLWASILYASILSHFKNFVTRKFLIQTSFDKSHAHWHTWMSFSKKRMNHQ